MEKNDVYFIKNKKTEIIKNTLKKKDKILIKFEEFC